MLDIKLFLAFNPDALFQKELRKANPYLVNLFIGKEEYLQEVSHEGKRYFAKPLPSLPTVGQIEDLEKHLISILGRLAPCYPFEENPPQLLTISK